jgi:hypothetical protein
MYDSVPPDADPSDERYGFCCYQITDRGREELKPANYWQKFSEKWFSHWWSIPLTALVVLAPIVAQYIMWGYNVYLWSKGKPASQTAPQDPSAPAKQSGQKARP